MPRNTALDVQAPFVVQRSADCAATRNPGNYYLPMDVSSRFGVRLRQLRRERNLTQLADGSRLRDRPFFHL